jgi:PIN domain nuclease of toxin-antitoxin system
MSRSTNSQLSEQKPNITTSPVDRVGIADAAIEKAISMLSPDAQFDGEPPA